MEFKYTNKYEAKFGNLNRDLFNRWRPIDRGPIIEV